MIFDEAFASEVRANPDDDMARLVLADFLSDSGDPLGQLIRLQLELVDFKGAVEQKLDLQRQEESLLKEHGEQWLEPLRNMGVKGCSLRCFRRGLVERIKISVKDFVDHADEIIAISPGLHILQLTDLELDSYQLLTLAPQIRTVDLSNSKIGTAENANGLLGFRADWIGDLEGLNLEFNRLASRDLIDLFAVSKGNLKSLRLGMNQISTVGLDYIIDGISFPQLEELSLNLNRIDVGAGESFSLTNGIDNLRSLNLASNPLTDDGIVPLLNSHHFPELRNLNLRNCNLSGNCTQLINESQLVKQLETIDLRNNNDQIFNGLDPEVLKKAGRI